MTTTFDGNDPLYQEWLAAHPRGFVINTRRRISPDYMVLHRASCDSISQYTEMARPGGFTERNFIKIGASTAEELRVWASRHGRSDGSFSSEGCFCNRSTA